MAASPVEPPSEQQILGLQSLWNWLWPAVSSAFGAGAVWGLTRSTVADHDRRLTRLEESVPAAMRAIGDKIDENHREVMRLIVNIAQTKKSGD